MNLQNVLGVVYPTSGGMAIAADYCKLVVPDRSVKGLAEGDLVIVTGVTHDTKPEEEQRGVCFVRARKLQQSGVTTPHSWSAGISLQTSFEYAGKFVRLEDIDSDSPQIVVKRADMLLVGIDDRRVGRYRHGFDKKRFAMRGDWVEEEVRLPFLREENDFSSVRGVCIKTNFLKSLGRDWAEFLLCSSEWDSGNSRRAFYPNWAFSPLEVDETDLPIVQAVLAR